MLSKPFNTEKALKMALVHDLPEIIIGDKSPMGEDGTGQNTFAFDKQEEKIKRKQENFEAQVVKSLDSIEAMIQVLEYTQGHLFKDHLKFTIEYGLKACYIDPAIAQFGELIAEKLRRCFREFRK